MTNNVPHFAAIAKRWAAQGRSHAGLIFTTDASIPRSEAIIGRFVSKLDRLLQEYSQESALTDRITWL